MKFYILAVILSLLIIFCNPSSFSATGIKATGVSGAVGDTVNIDISTDGVLELTVLRCEVSYDETKLKLTGVKDGGILGEYSHSNNLTSPYILYWNNNIATTNFSASGILATLTFEIIGESTQIAVTVSEGDALSAYFELIPVPAITIDVTVECDHVFGEYAVTKAPTETMEGEKTRICTICGETDTVPIEKLKAPTETSEGNHTHVYTYKTETLLAPTCTENGITRTYCSCGAFSDLAVAALGHTPGEWTTIKNPTKDDEGERCLFCVNCGTIVSSETIPKLTSDETIINIDENTVEEQSSSELKEVTTPEEAAPAATQQEASSPEASRTENPQETDSQETPTTAPASSQPEDNETSSPTKTEETEVSSTAEPPIAETGENEAESSSSQSTGTPSPPDILPAETSGTSATSTTLPATEESDDNANLTQSETISLEIPPLQPTEEVTNAPVIESNAESTVETITDDVQTPANDGSPSDTFVIILLCITGVIVTISVLLIVFRKKIR